MNPLALLPARRMVLALALPPLVVGAVAAGLWIYRPAPVAPAAAAARAGADLAAGPAEPALLIHVTGAVAAPGVYRLKRGPRIADAISAAGGVTGAADQARLPDLAGILRDGQQVRVPVLGRGGSTGRAAAVDLNTATEAELAAIPGFTPDLARQTVQYRGLYGAFTSVRELETGVGMEPAAYALARRYVRV